MKRDIESISSQWAAFIRGLEIDAVPAGVVEKTKLRLLD